MVIHANAEAGMPTERNRQAIATILKGRKHRLRHMGE